MELQGIAKCAFHLNHDFIPSSFQAAAVFKKHRFFLVLTLAEKTQVEKNSVLCHFSKNSGEKSLKNWVLGLILLNKL